MREWLTAQTGTDTMGNIALAANPTTGRAGGAEEERPDDQVDGHECSHPSSERVPAVDDRLGRDARCHRPSPSVKKYLSTTARTIAQAKVIP